MQQGVATTAAPSGSSTEPIETAFRDCFSVVAKCLPATSSGGGTSVKFGEAVDVASSKSAAPPRRSTTPLIAMPLSLYVVRPQSLTDDSLGSVTVAWEKPDASGDADDAAKPYALRWLPISDETATMCATELGALVDIGAPHLQTVVGMIQEHADADGVSGRSALLGELIDFDLADLLGSLPVPRAASDWPEALLDVAIGIVDGLSFLHSYQVSHGALTPSTIRIHCRPDPSRSGGVALVAKLSDYGVANVPGLGARTTLFSAPELLATPSASTTTASSGQMADELVEARAAQDIWSLGCVLVAMATREAPYPELRKSHALGNSLTASIVLTPSISTELAEAITTGQQRPSELIDNDDATPPEIATLITSCTTLEAEGRPTAQQLTKLLEMARGHLKKPLPLRLGAQLTAFSAQVKEWREPGARAAAQAQLARGHATVSSSSPDTSFSAAKKSMFSSRGGGFKKSFFSSRKS